MRLRSTWLTLGVLLATTAVINCNGVTEPTHTDLEEAWETWVSGDIQEYQFQIAFESSWIPRSDWIQIEVAGDTVEQVIGQWEHWATPNHLTIDTLWARILAAEERDEMNEARFNARGVPIYADMGPWLVDGGVRYWVRRFVPRGP